MQCIVLEFVARGSLYDLLQSDEQLSGQTMLMVLKGVCDGMAHLHDENVVHRDLAARNVLLDHNLVPKLGDFGMSRVLERSDKNQTKSDTGPLKWMVRAAHAHLVAVSFFAHIALAHTGARVNQEQGVLAQVGRVGVCRRHYRGADALLGAVPRPRANSGGHARRLRKPGAAHSARRIAVHDSRAPGMLRARRQLSAGIFRRQPDVAI